MQQSLPSTASAALARRFLDVRSATEALCAGISEADAVVQSMPDASPVKWHLAHTTWFFETFVLEQAQPGYVPFDPAYRVLFNSYYNGVGDKHPRPERGLVTRPGLEEIRAYRRAIDARVVALLDGARDRPLPEAAIVELGLHHEQQHQELILTDFKHLLSRNPLHPAYQPSWPLMKIAARTPGWIPYEGGLHEIGHAGDGFAFDNESPRHRVWLEAFELSAYPVTNAEYLEFMADGGYERPELWLSLGWDTMRAAGWTAPAYWLRGGSEWQVFTLHGVSPLNGSTPVSHLSYFEADAFARWAGARLPTEAEWEVAASACTETIAEGNFVETGMLHPVPARAPRREGRPAQMLGDVWEWTSSSYAPYPRFRPAAGLVGEYNGKFMCNQYVLRGGSCATPASHIRATYRNFFPPDARWQFSGLRLARDR